MTYLAIDLETTGLNFKKDRILEIGAVRIENGSLRETFCALINPHCPIPTKITQLTGITQQMADGGEELLDVLPRFLAFAGTSPILAHNLHFDYSFLKQACVNAKLSFAPSGIDTLKLARRFLPTAQEKKLVALRTLFQLDTGTAHRALSDALAAALVYERLFSDYSTADESAFLPVPLHVNIKKQQPITIPQKEQLRKLLSAFPDAVPDDLAIDTLTRSDASRLIERLLHS